MESVDDRRGLIRIPMKRLAIKVARSTIRKSAGLCSMLLPLEIRKGLVLRIERLKFRWVPDFSIGILEDLRRHDPEALHRFLWSNHLAYAATYEPKKKFEASSLNPTRQLLFRQIVDYYRSSGLNPQEQIRSVFEVGCSLGYLLRYLELYVLPAAAPLHGIDIDRYAVRTGMSYLQSVNSKVQLFDADVAKIGEATGNQQYDLVLSCGVLMYLNKKTAKATLQKMFALSRRLVGIICTAHQGDGGATLNSETRKSDGAYLHDMHSMIRESGHYIISSTFVDFAESGSSPSYVILAR
ncbi:MAG TPA: class I SAM-dependent methyltransferase [Bryobacteraceae bacterium]|nr:class I SAM-dependent methyltransferase [Bryobacteraceae bacterium]